MSSPWQLSKEIESQLGQWLEDFQAAYGQIGYSFYPSIMWNLGGYAWKPEDPSGSRIDLPARYSAGFYRRDPLPEGFVFVPSERFGLVVFLPRTEDLASDRRSIDFDGEWIVVR